MNLYKGSPTFVVTTGSDDFLGLSGVVVLVLKEVESVKLISSNQSQEIDENGGGRRNGNGVSRDRNS